MNAQFLDRPRRRAIAYAVGPADPRQDGDGEERILLRPLGRGLLYEAAVAVALVAVATLVRLALGYIAPDIVPSGVFYPSILLAALFGGWRSGALATVLVMLAAWFLFMAPPGHLVPSRPREFVNLGFLTASSLAIVALGGYVADLVSRLEKGRARLTERNVHYDAIFDTMSEGFALCEAIWDDAGGLGDYQVVELNPALRRMLGVGPEAIGAKLSDTPGDRRGWLELCERVLKSGRPEGFEYRNAATGLWHEIHVSRVTGSKMAQFFFDITERKLAEARQGQLFEELNHRVKNNLTLVASLLQMQARGSEDAVRDQLMKAVDRVHSIAQVHAALHRGARREDVDFGAYLQELCASLAKSLIDDDRIALEVEVEPVDLSIDAAIPLGMVVNELVTNAVKYAYPPPRSGAISVCLRRHADGVTLSVGDSGCGLPGDPQGRPGGLGMKLVNALVAQVGGRLVIRRQPGATFEVRLPATPPGEGARLL